MKRLVFSIILTLAIAMGSQHFIITSHHNNQRSISSTSSSTPYNYEMNLDFYVSQRLLGSKNIAEIENLIDKQVQNAQTCVEHIFKKRKNITLKITKKDIHWLSDEEFLRLGKDNTIPDLDTNGEPIEELAGNQTNQFKVFVGDFQSSFAANVHNATVAKVIEKNAVLKVLSESSAINNEIINFQFLHGNDDSKYSPENLKKFKTLLDKQSVLEEKVSKKTAHLKPEDVKKITSLLRVSNVVKITPDVLNEIFDENSNTLIHELFHAFGGFHDLYTDPKNTQANIMGAYHGGNTCILNETQIKEMINYRK